MATSSDYFDYIIDKLDDSLITYRPMMGEYLLYYKGVLFGGLYDDRFLIKKNDNNLKYNLSDNIPYKGAKSMYLVDTDEVDLLKKIVIDTYQGLIK